MQGVGRCRSTNADVAAAKFCSIVGRTTGGVDDEGGVDGAATVPRPWRNLWSDWKRSTVPAFVVPRHPRKICLCRFFPMICCC